MKHLLRTALVFLSLGVAHPAGAQPTGRVELCQVPGWQQRERVVPINEFGDGIASFPLPSGVFFLEVLTSEGFTGEARVFFLNVGAGTVVRVKGTPGEVVRVFLCSRAW